MLGFSDGGIVAYRLALALPQRVSGIVAVGAQWRLRRTDPEYAILGGLTAADWDEMFPRSRAQYESVNPSPDFDRLVERVVSLWTDLGPGGYPGEAVRGIQVPTLIVRGDGDIFLSLGEAAQLRDAIPGASLFNIPLSDHDVVAGAPGLFIAGVAGFLDNPKKA